MRSFDIARLRDYDLKGLHSSGECTILGQIKHKFIKISKVKIFWIFNVVFIPKIIRTPLSYFSCVK